MKAPSRRATPRMQAPPAAAAPPPEYLAMAAAQQHTLGKLFTDPNTPPAAPDGN